MNSFRALERMENSRNGTLARTILMSQPSLKRSLESQSSEAPLKKKFRHRHELTET